VRSLTSHNPIGLHGLLRGYPYFSGLENREYGVGILRADHATPFYQQKFALTSPTSGGRSVGIVRLRSKVMELCYVYETAKITVGTEILAVMVMRNYVFWDITPLRPVKVNTGFRGTNRFHPQGERASHARHEHEVDSNQSELSSFHFQKQLTRPEVLKDSSIFPDTTECIIRWKRTGVSEKGVFFTLHCSGSSCCPIHAGLLLDLLFDPKDECDIFLRNVSWLSRRYIPEDNAL
jgi:hypothetical protein